MSKPRRKLSELLAELDSRPVRYCPKCGDKLGFWHKEPTKYSEETGKPVRWRVVWGCTRGRVTEEPGTGWGHPLEEYYADAD